MQSFNFLMGKTAESTMRCLCVFLLSAGTGGLIRLLVTYGVVLPNQAASILLLIVLVVGVACWFWLKRAKIAHHHPTNRRTWAATEYATNEWIAVAIAIGLGLMRGLL